MTLSVYNRTRRHEALLLNGWVTKCGNSWVLSISLLRTKACTHAPLKQVTYKLVDLNYSAHGCGADLEYTHGLSPEVRKY